MIMVTHRPKFIDWIHLRQQIPESLRKRLVLHFKSDPYGLTPKAHFLDPDTGRKFECNLTDDWKLPEEFVAHLCAVV